MDGQATDFKHAGARFRMLFDVPEFDPANPTHCRIWIQAVETYWLTEARKAARAQSELTTRLNGKIATILPKLKAENPKLSDTQLREKARDLVVLVDEQLSLAGRTEFDFRGRPLK